MLRYVDVAGTDAGLTLVEHGYAIARYDSRDGYGAHPREAAYIAADDATANLDEAARAGLRACDRRVWRICRDNRCWSVFGKKRTSNGKKAGPPAHDDLTPPVFSRGPQLSLQPGAVSSSGGVPVQVDSDDQHLGGGDGRTEASCAEPCQASYGGEVITAGHVAEEASSWEGPGATVKSASTPPSTTGMADWRGATMTIRQVVATVVCGVLAFGLGGSAVAAPGAPPPGSGDLEVPHHVRIIDGDSIDAIVGGNRIAIGLIGLRAPLGNTDCGRKSKDKLEELERLARGRGGGPRFVEDGEISFDARGRRMYYLEERAGRSLAREMVKGGWAHADGRGKEKRELAAEEENARKAKRGCLWDGKKSSAPPPAGHLNALGQASVKAPWGSTAAAAATAEASATAAPEVAPPEAAALPSGFTQDTVASGLGTPTSFAMLPDGRILIAQQNGVVRLVKNGALQSAPFIDISAKVNNYWDRGLVGIAADANFATNGYVYLLYTYEDDPATYNQSKTARLTRVTASGDTASLATERTLLGTVTGSTCKAFPVEADCIPSDYFGHTVGSVKSASDGTLYLTVGESASWNVVTDDALRAQNLRSLAGKVLHVTSLGQGLASNPHYTGDVNANQSKVWATGLRNPYRMNLRPGTNVPFLGDVGWDTWEEINVATAGANLGWPCYEGNGRQSGYEPKQTCQDLYAEGPGAVRTPLTTWNHNGSSAAATGGTFYQGTSFPEEYRGAYFYGDYAAGFIRYIKVDENNQPIGAPVDFATGGNPVDIEMGADGHLYVLDIFAGELRRFRYGSPQLPPPPTASAYLSDLTSTTSVNGWGPVERDTSNGEQAAGDGVAMRVQGVAFARGLGVHAGSDVRYNLGGRCTRFQAKFGVDDEVPDSGPSMTYSVLADGVTLAAGSATGATPAQTVDVDVSGRNELRLLAGDGGDGNSWDHGDWADAFLVCSGSTPPPPSGTTHLSDLTPSTATSGWGPVEKDRSNGEQAAGDGGALTIQGTVYARGLGVHADSILTYPLQAKCSRFTAEVGVDDEVNDVHPSVQFTVSADGAVLFDSGVMSGLDAASSIDVDVTGRSTLTLAVDDVDGNAFDHADWADAKLTCSTSTNAPPTVNIASPAAALTYGVGDIVTYSGSASDPEDGAVPASALTWKVLTHHCPGGSCHVHTISTQTGTTGGTFTVPDHGDDSYLEFQLTAVDRGGATSTGSVVVRPKTVELTIATSPSGLQVVYDGTAYTAPVKKVTIVGSRHTIQTASPQGANVFANWSDGGAQQHEVVAGAAAQTYTATFRAEDTTPPTVASLSPAPGATRVAVGATVTGVFSEAMNTSTISPNTVRLVRNGTTAPVAATVTYDAAARRVNLRPSASLARGTTYTATILGGSSGVTDAAGNAMTANQSWSFSTRS